jgi:hypothetical protein
MVCAIELGFLFLVSLDKAKKAGGRPRPIGGVSVGRPYSLVLQFCAVIGFVMFLVGIVLGNFDAMIEAAVWLVVVFSAYLFFYAKSQHR